MTTKRKSPGLANRYKGCLGKMAWRYLSAGCTMPVMDTIEPIRCAVKARAVQMPLGRKTRKKRKLELRVSVSVSATVRIGLTDRFRDG
jgi:hypothetical protein